VRVFLRLDAPARARSAHCQALLLAGLDGKNPGAGSEVFA
jgi:hypothetical protein